ncbi:DUF3265 domain-containing protein [Vibrio parahaemolyticus]|nr:DUF3265 domain-containing protein [Vibrio parahaemolyticus]EJG0687801.1 DUF3265 domain-containing protein [Vibrio parahaemolyticus]EJG0730846.1 DUF3265 domain-containing protein [Vibrio parahaemolyticus]EJG0795942.1 DUF3265 domain-containing protein [Vibrio parahaemolyticus]EJG0928884.1 DUF3265 domain-containing protein [Vibrio parahaemolyticus]
MTKHLSAIHNAWHFWFASSFVFKAQCGSRCVLRCSRLNAALCALGENGNGYSRQIQKCKIRFIPHSGLQR